MARVKRAVNAEKEHKSVLEQTKEYFGAKSKLCRPANQAVMRSLTYVYIGRERRKREFYKLWIARINATTRLNELSYSKFISGLKGANIEINRKMLSELAIRGADALTKLIEVAKENI